MPNINQQATDVAKTIQDWLTKRLNGEFICAICLLVFAILSTTNFTIFPRSVLILICVVGIGYLRSWLVPVVLFALLANLFYTEIPTQPGDTLSVSGLAIAIVTIGLTIVASMYVTLHGHILPTFNRRALKQLPSNLNQTANKSDSKHSATSRPRDTKTFHPSELVFNIGIGIAALLIGTMVLAAFPILPTEGRAAGLLPVAHRLIRMSAGVAIGGTIIIIAIKAIAWRLMGPREARIYLRNVLGGWLTADNNRLARIRRKRDAKV